MYFVRSRTSVPMLDYGGTMRSAVLDRVLKRRVRKRRLGVFIGSRTPQR